MANDIFKLDIYSKEGHLVFSTENFSTENEKISQILEEIESNPVALKLLKDLCGLQNDSSPKVTRSQVLKEAENLGFVSKDGAVKGFLNILPKATLLNSCLESFNQAHLSALNAVRIDFPYIFDNSASDTRELTKSYERQNRMFSLGKEDSTFRLSYAADPGLFSWLRHKKISDASLPYTVYTPLEILRRFQAGEIAGLDILRQYHVPDMHIFETIGKAHGCYLNNFSLSVDDTRQLFQEDFACFHEIAEDLHSSNSTLGADTARAVRKPVLVFWKRTRDRYYGIKSGIHVDAGFGAIRLFTMQWDDTNAELFNITHENNEKIIIIHATLAGGWPKILPIVLGQAIASGQRYIPAHLSSHHITCLALNHGHIEPLQQLVSDLQQKGIRAKIDTQYNLSLGERIKKEKEKWHEFILVYGDHESKGKEPIVTALASGQKIALSHFVSEKLDFLKKFIPSPGLLCTHLPYKA